MFELVIEHHAARTVSPHPSQHEARLHMVAHLEAIACDYQIAQAAHDYTTYLLTDLTDDAGDERIVGQAVIENLQPGRHAPTAVQHG
ncbi:MAG: hypothetical protein K2X52_06520 [Mycobacteriaceae bacterium]|nr:hypothetical protein [Mycobacteriaceae bacterium]